MAKKNRRRGPRADPNIQRCVVKLTLRTNNPDHVRVKKMLDDSDNKGALIIQALLGNLAQSSIEEVEMEDIDDGWGDAIM